MTAEAVNSNAGDDLPLRRSRGGATSGASLDGGDLNQKGQPEKTNDVYSAALLVILGIRCVLTNFAKFISR